MKQPHFLTGAAWLTGSELISKAASLARTVLFARMLGAESFGVGATIWLSLALLDMMSNTNADKLLIQAPVQNLDRLQRTAQALSAGRGLGVGLLLATLAIPMSHWLGAPQAAAAYLVVALVPLIRGLSHLDPVRFQREHHFTAPAIAEVAGQTLALIIAAPLAFYFRDHWAMVWVAIAQTFTSTACTHLLASTPYRWSWDRDAVRAISTFGWPLLINGGLMWMILQGDQMIVALWRTPAEVGVYAAAFSLALGPTMIAARVMTGLLLPRYAKAQSDNKSMTIQMTQSSRYVAAAILVGGVAGILLSGLLMTRIFGNSFSHAGPLLAALILMQAVRILRIVPTLAAMSRGDTKNAMTSNLVRLASIPIAIAMAVAGLPLTAIALAAAAAEAVAWIVSARRLQKNHGISCKSHLKPGLLAVAVLGLAFLASLASSAPASVAMGLVALLVSASLLREKRVNPHSASPIAEAAPFWHAVYSYILRRPRKA